MAELHLDEISKIFAPTICAADAISLTVARGECVALVGPSGCGKSTLLRIIAGLEAQTAGDVFIDGVNVNAVPPHRRDVALLFQRPAFLVQKSVRHNLRPAWGWGSWFGSSVKDDELRRMAEMLGLAADLDRPVSQLSGGQQQRVALGRCLLRQAKVTLLDEPLGHLDAPLRTELRRQIRALARELGLTLVHVTHDPVEALAMGDRVAVMRQGRLLQVDEPRNLRRAPNHRAVAELTHHEDGGINWLAGAIVKEEFDSYFEGPFGRWPVSMQIVDRLRESLYKEENFAAGQGKVDIMTGIPAAAVCCTSSHADLTDDVVLAMKVQEIESMSAGSWVIGSAAAGRWIGKASEAERLERSQEVQMIFSMNRAYWFDAATGRALFAPTG
jgi:ABC-type sugar transport system ATPase subunit